MLTYTLPAGTACIDKQSNGQSLSWYQALLQSGVHAVLLDMMTGNVQPDIQNALTAELAVMIFQGFYTPAFAIPAQATVRAQMIVGAAKAAGFPSGQNAPVLWLDLEACGSVPADAIFSWVTNWGQVVQQAGYQAGLYVGAGQPLSSQQLYSIPTITHYWRSASNVPAVAVRGYEILQGKWNQIFEGVSVDYDTVQVDAKGSLPIAVTLSTGPNAPTFEALVQRVAALEQSVTTTNTHLTSLTNTLNTLSGTLQQAQHQLTLHESRWNAIKQIFNS